MNVYIGKPVVISDMQGPCDSGFHVPTADERETLYNVGQTLGIWSSSNGTNIKNYLKMPYAGRRFTNDSVNNQGSAGYYWSCIAYYNSGASTYYGYDMSFGNTYVYYKDTNYGVKSIGMSIRPFKDTPIVPDSTWSTIYQGTGTAGIFHNTTLGLISLSSDGTTWITIADKNLGATTVYNNGDTLAESNCGEYYQRGNNYGFVWTGTISNTSSTQVNASTYGPGNYYNSNTFITANPRDSSNNANLRGGVSQGTSTKDVELKNAYIGEVYEYSYDFRNKSSTILANDGWTNASSYTTTFSSQGISGQSIRYTKPIDLSNASRLTLSCTGKGGSDNEYGFRVGQTVTTSTRAGLTGVNYTYNQILLSLFSTSQYFSGVTSGSHKIDFILDFNAKTFEIKIDGNSFQNGTVTDSQISNIKNNTTVLFAYVSGGGGDYYLETVSIILE